jgi:hypothetical protein
VRVSHYSYGWVVFMITLALFFAYVRYRAPNVRMRIAAAFAAPAETATRVRGHAGRASLALAIAALPFALNLVIGARLAPDDTQIAALQRSAEMHGWRAVLATDSTWKPVQPNADREVHLRFANGAESLELFAADYIEQRQRRKLGGRASYPGGIGVEVVDESVVQAAGKTFATQQLEHDGMRASVWRIYEVADRWFTSATRAQFWYSAQTFVTLRSPRSRVWLLRSECAEGCAAADAALTRFVEENGGILWPESP